MSDKLDEALVDIIKKATSGVDSAVDFLGGQIPDVVSQLLAFELFVSIFWTLVFSVFLIGSAILTKKGFCEEFENSEVCGFSALVGLVFFVISFIVVSINATTAIKIWLAPKIFLLEYAADLVE